MTLSREDSGLADFLINRGVRNPIFGNRLHWYLMIELENKLTKDTYGRVAYKFMQKIMEVNIARIF
jgi:phosphatidylinositol 3-kinase